METKIFASSRFSQELISDLTIEPCFALQGQKKKKTGLAAPLVTGSRPVSSHQKPLRTTSLS
jgi:hypothetical protein